MPTYRLTRKAKLDLKTIWNYTYNTWSQTQADQYLSNLMAEFDTISTSPNKGKNYKGLDPMILGLKKNKHIIFYRIVEPGTVEVIRILHEAMDIPGRMTE